MKLAFALSVLSVFVALTGCEVRERLPEIAPAKMQGDRLPALGTPVAGRITSIGAATRAFIPERPTSLAGFGGSGRRFIPPFFTSDGAVAFCKPYQKVLHPPRIKTAIFDVTATDGQQQNLFFISLDMVAVTGDLLEKIHPAINMAAEKTNTTTQLHNTTVVASHTHSGVAGLTENPLWGTFVCDQYNAALTQNYLDVLKETVVSALANRKLISGVETLSIRSPELLTSRSESMKSNDQVTLLHFKGPDDRPVLSLLQLAAHPTTFGTKDLVLTSDLVSPLEEAVRQSTGSENVFLMQTEIGNMAARINGREIDSWALSLASALQSESSAKSLSTDLNIKTSAGFIDLPAKKINWQGCDAAAAQALLSADILNALPKKAPYSTWQLQGETYLFLPGEWTTSAAETLREQFSKKIASPRPLKIFSLSNDYTGYHLSPADYEKKSLESCSSIYGPTVPEDFARIIPSPEPPL